jgi:hypothetical protein
MSDPLVFVITDAGRAALPSPDNTGVTSVKVTQIGVSASAFTADAAMIALPGEIKRLATFGGSGVAADTIHVTIRDETAAAYSLRSFALYLDDGTLFGLYGQAAVISEKTSASLLLLSADFKTADIDATVIEFGSTDFQNPPATETVMGVLALATNAEAQTGTNPAKAITPKTLAFALAAWLAAQFSNVWRSTNDGAGSGLDADLLDGQQGAWYADIAARLGYTPLNQTAYTAADVLAKLLTVDGAGSALDAGLLAGQLPAYYTAITARLGYTPLNQTAYTAADVLAKLLTVDGAGSGIDADLFDGQQASYYTAITARLGYTPLNQTAYTAADVKTKLLTVDGSGSGLDADLLDGKHATSFVEVTDVATVSAAGIIEIATNAEVLAGTDSVRAITPVSMSYTLDQLNYWRSGNDGAGSGMDADLLDGQQGNYYLAASAYTAGDVKAKLVTVDGSGSGIDADTLDGLQAAAFALLGLSNSVLPTGSNANGTWFKIGNLIIQCGQRGTVGPDTTATVTYPLPLTASVPFFYIAGTRLSSFDSGADSFGQIIGTPGLATMTVDNQRVNNSATIDVPWLIMAWA